MMIPINWWALIVTVVVSFLLGNLWYGPLFGKRWMKEIGIEMPSAMTPEMKKMMWRSMIGVVICSFLMNFVLLHVLVYGAAYTMTSGVAAGLMVGFWNWLGFVVPPTVNSVLFERRSWTYWTITSGYYLVALLINGVILSVWM